MAKRQPSKAAEKAAEKKDAGECPVTDAPCENNCAKDECQATVSQDVAQKMIDSGEAEIPSESIVKSSPKGSDLENHPKFDKYKTGGQPL